MRYSELKYTSSKIPHPNDTLWDNLHSLWEDVNTSWENAHGLGICIQCDEGLTVERKVERDKRYHAMTSRSW